MRTSHVLKLVALSAAALFVWVALYSAWVVVSARRYTESTVLPAARSAHYPLAVSDLSPRQLEILLKVEDPTFFTHRGVDLWTPGAGITTLTQGLVKHLYFSDFKPGLAKYKQTLIAAFALDPLMPKNEQLRLFLNTAYLGPGGVGFEAAAQHNFGKPFKQLTEDEFMALVALVVAPGVFDLKQHPERNAERVARIKKLVSGQYQPKGLFDVYYGKIDAEGQKQLAPLSYFASYYE